METVANNGVVATATPAAPQLDLSLTGTSPAPTVPAQGQLPGVPGISQADIEALTKAKTIEAAQRTAGGLVRFESTFKLESEREGEAALRKSLKRKTSKSGAVMVGLLPLTSKTDVSLSSVTGFKGEELKAYSRMESDALKADEAQQFARLASSQEWTGLTYGLNSKGTEVTFKLKKVEAMKVSVTPVMTEAEMLAKLGLTPEEYAPIKAAKAKAAAAAAAQAAALAAAAATPPVPPVEAPKAPEAIAPNPEAPQDADAKELADIERELAELEAQAANNGAADITVS